MTMNNHDLQSHNEAMLTEAQKLNCDLGMHVKNCSFSTQLSGRFYQNNSLESHKARAHRIAQMKAKRKQLERSLFLEEKKIRYLETKLKERKAQRLKEEELKLKKEQAAIKIQSQARRVLSKKKLDVLIIESEIINYVVRFLQSLYRGSKDRQRVHQLRMSMIRHRKEEYAAIQIQTYFRRFMAQMELGKRLEHRFRQYNHAACMIQASLRGSKCRQTYRTMRRNKAATTIQANFRGFLGRRIRDARIFARKKRKEKAQRIPLHERRYSIYSMDTSRRESDRRRFTDISSKTTTRTSNASSMTRRLTGLEILRLAHHSKNEHKENSKIDLNSKTRESLCMRNLDPRIIKEDKSVDKPKDTPKLAVSSEEDEKNALARQRAAARAAKLKRQSELEKEKKLKETQDKKIELKKIELNRRNKIKSKSNKLAKEGNHPILNKTQSSYNGILDSSVKPKTTEGETKCNIDDDMCKIVLDVAFNDFEEQFEENECDLDEMG